MSAPPPPPGPPPPSMDPSTNKKKNVTPAGSAPRVALLGSISGFTAGALKKIVTADRSAPMLEEAQPHAPRPHRVPPPPSFPGSDKPPPPPPPAYCPPVPLSAEEIAELAAQQALQAERFSAARRDCVSVMAAAAVLREERVAASIREEAQEWARTEAALQATLAHFTPEQRRAHVTARWLTFLSAERTESAMDAARIEFFLSALAADAGREASLLSLTQADSAGRTLVLSLVHSSFLDPPANFRVGAAAPSLVEEQRLQRTQNLERAGWAHFLSLVRRMTTDEANTLDREGNNALTLACLPRQKSLPENAPGRVDLMAQLHARWGAAPVNRSTLCRFGNPNERLTQLLDALLRCGLSIDHCVRYPPGGATAGVRGATPLHLAATHAADAPDAMQWLLRRNANISAADDLSVVISRFAGAGINAPTLHSGNTYAHRLVQSARGSDRHFCALFNQLGAHCVDWSARDASGATVIERSALNSRHPLSLSTLLRSEHSLMLAIDSQLPPLLHAHLVSDLSVIVKGYVDGSGYRFPVAADDSITTAPSICIQLRAVRDPPLLIQGINCGQMIDAAPLPIPAAAAAAASAAAPLSSMFPAASGEFAPANSVPPPPAPPRPSIPAVHMSLANLFPNRTRGGPMPDEDDDEDEWD